MLYVKKLVSKNILLIMTDFHLYELFFKCLSAKIFKDLVNRSTNRKEYLTFWQSYSLIPELHLSELGEMINPRAFSHVYRR